MTRILSAIVITALVVAIVGAGNDRPSGGKVARTETIAMEAR